MKAVKVQADGSVKLPPEIRHRFPSRSELLVWTEGDTIVRDVAPGHYVVLSSPFRAANSLAE